jgi:hypothetical protein
MSRTFRMRLTGLLVAVTALALAGDGAGILSATGGRVSPLAANARPRLLALPSPAWRADPAPESSAPVPAASPAASKVTEPPTPVVDGVARTNVGSAHSPQALALLSSSPVTMPPPSDAGALGVDVADYQHPN